MAFTTREIENPDPVTRVVAADAELRDQRAEHPGDDIGEKMVINMGPSHPATHGVLRIVLELDGEIITKATPDVGYLHRGDEKIAENMQYNQFVPYTDRLDYLAPLANNVAYALAVEKLMGWELPPRGKAIRVICCELARISAHLLGLGAMALDLGAMTVFLYTFHEREKIYDLVNCSPARVSPPVIRAWADKSAICPRILSRNWKSFSTSFGPKLDEMRSPAHAQSHLCRSHARHWRDSNDRAMAYALSGPNLRGSGVEHDLRRKHPYLDYDQFDFEVVDRNGRRLLRPLSRSHGGNAAERANLAPGDRQTAERPDQCRRLEEYATAEIARDDKDGRIDPSFHGRDRRSESAAGRNLFRGGESEGRTRFLYQQQRRRSSAPAENSRAFVRQSQHSTGIAAGLYDERRGGDFGQFGFRYGRM